MTTLRKKSCCRVLGLLFAVALLAAAPAMAEGYDNAFKDVQGLDAVFEYSQGNPKITNVIFVAIKDAYEDKDVRALAKPPGFVIVFHGPAVKLISSDKSMFNAAQWAEVEKFHATLRQMKEAGVGMEVCLYAADVLGVDKDTIIPEIDRVLNGFVSVIGYQMQGYGVVRIP